jgi:hypothetical protein
MLPQREFLPIVPISHTEMIELGKLANKIDQQAETSENLLRFTEGRKSRN